MSTISGSRTFHSTWDTQFVTALAHSVDVFQPSLLIEIRGKKVAGFIKKHRVHARDEITTILVSAGEMQGDDLIGHGEELTARALDTLDFTFVAEPSNPFVGARGAVAGLAALPALKPLRVDIIPAAKQRPEQCDLLLR